MRCSTVLHSCVTQEQIKGASGGYMPVETGWSGTIMPVPSGTRMTLNTYVEHRKLYSYEEKALIRSLCFANSIGCFPFREAI